MTKNNVGTTDQRLSLKRSWQRSAVQGRGRSLRRTNVVAGALAVALSVAAGALWFVNSANADEETARSEATSAAKENVETLLSYDYRTISDAMEARSDLVTGDFKSEYAELVNDQVAPAARERGVVTRTEVVTTSVISADPEQASLLLFLNQVSATKRSQVPVLSGSRVRVEMKKVDGTWRVADLTPL